MYVNYSAPAIFLKEKIPIVAPSSSQGGRTNEAIGLPTKVTGGKYLYVYICMYLCIYICVYKYIYIHI
jgi:hypothetical protein